MSKLRAFVHLDFMTAKTGFQWQVAVFYLGIIIITTSVARMALIPAWLVMSFMGSFFTAPFSVGEPRNMDALYATLNVNAQTVVKGRYIYVFTALGLSGLLTALMIGICLLLENILDINTYAGAALGLIASLLAMNVFTLSMQLPIYFKFGIAKSGGWAGLPSILLMLLPLFLFTGFLRHDFVERVLRLLEYPPAVAAGFGLVLLALAVMVYVSYRVSVRLYTHTKREF